MPERILVQKVMTWAKLRRIPLAESIQGLIHRSDSVIPTTESTCLPTSFLPRPLLRRHQACKLSSVCPKGMALFNSHQPTTPNPHICDNALKFLPYPMPVIMIIQLFIYTGTMLLPALGCLVIANSEEPCLCQLGVMLFSEWVVGIAVRVLVKIQ